MAFKTALILSAIAQLLAAGLALRINFRYRIYSAWFLLSSAACVGAILRLTTLSEVWAEAPTLSSNRTLWLSAIASLLASILLLAGMAMIEPFFKRIAQAERALRQEHRQLSTFVRETEEEMKLAQRIQRRLLPSKPVELPNIDVCGESRAAVWTSGDYYDYLPLRNQETAIVIADVCGHGVGPALLMSSTRASLRGLSPTLDDVGELLTHGNRAILDCVSSSEFVTAFAARYDARAHRLYFAGAGHVGYLLKAEGTSLRLDASAPPLGILAELCVETSCVEQVHSGDMLILATDGILERRNPQHEMFGDVRLVETARKHRKQSAAKIVQELMDASTRFASNELQADDITVVILKVV